MKRVAIQVQCMIQDAWGWCTGTTQRDGTGREVGGRFTTYKNVICTVAYLLESQGLFRRLKCFLTNTITLLLIMAPSKPDPHSQCLDGRVFTVAGLELFSHRVSYFWLQRKYFCPSRACWSLSVGFRETILSAHVSSPSSQVL